MPPLTLPLKSSRITPAMLVAAPPEQPLLPIDDLEESAWVYTRYSRQPGTVTEKITSRLGAFDWESSWKRKMLRVVVKDGVCSLSLYDDDASMSPTHHYELANLADMAWRFVAESDALAFAGAGGTTNDVFDGSSIITSQSFVYGQIGVQLYILDPRYKRQFNTLGYEKEARDRLLATPGVAQRVAFAFGSTQEAEAWYDWFAEFVLLRERMQVETPDGELSAAVASPPVFKLTGPNVRFIKEYTFHFLRRAGSGGGGFLGGLLSVGGGGGGVGPPNNGKLRAKAPDSGDYLPVYLTARPESAEIFFATRKPGSLIDTFTETRYTRRLHLVDRCRIVATSAFGTEFIVDMEPLLATEQQRSQHRSQRERGALADDELTADEVYRSGAAGPGGATALLPTTHSKATWCFLCKTVKQRNGFIEWLRLVKGRGTKAQSDEETYPFMINAMRDEEGEEGDGAGGGGGGAFDAAHRMLAARLRETSAMTFGSRGDGQSTQDRDDGDGDDRDGIGPKGGDVSKASGGSARRVDFKGTVVASDPAAEARRREEEALLALYPSDSPSSGGSSDRGGSIHSARPFRPFPTYAHTVLWPYLEEQLSWHMVGRPLPILRAVYGQLEDIPPALVGGPQEGQGGAATGGIGGGALSVHHRSGRTGGSGGAGIEGTGARGRFGAGAGGGTRPHSPQDGRRGSPARAGPGSHARGLGRGEEGLAVPRGAGGGAGAEVVSPLTAFARLQAERAAQQRSRAHNVAAGVGDDSSRYALSPRPAMGSSKQPSTGLKHEPQRSTGLRSGTPTLSSLYRGGGGLITAGNAAAGRARLHSTSPHGRRSLANTSSATGTGAGGGGVPPAGAFSARYASDIHGAARADALERQLEARDRKDRVMVGRTASDHRYTTNSNRGYGGGLGGLLSLPAVGSTTMGGVGSNTLADDDDASQLYTVTPFGDDEAAAVAAAGGPPQHHLLHPIRTPPAASSYSFRAAAAVASLLPVHRAASLHVPSLGVGGLKGGPFSSGGGGDGGLSPRSRAKQMLQERRQKR